jgi:Zn-finger nucleic acid-binding protein
MKEVVLKVCRRCQSVWFMDNKQITLRPEDQLEIISINIAYCMNCEGSWDQTSGGGPGDYGRTKQFRRRRPSPQDRIQ